MSPPLDRRRFLHAAGAVTGGSIVAAGTGGAAFGAPPVSAAVPAHPSNAASNAASASIRVPSHPQARPDPHPLSQQIFRRIAFGSCAHQDRPQPIWDAVLEQQPDLFIFLGDNVYGDTRDPVALAECYARLGAQPGFARLRASTPLLATWDDHDYGENDAGRDYPMKRESQRVFCDFWGEAASSPRRIRDGIFAGYVFGDPMATGARRVQILLPDLRFNRSPLTVRPLGTLTYDAWADARQAAGEPVPGPYERNPDSSASQLGETQWRWLEEQLTIPATVRILASSLQVVADFPGWEAWSNYPADLDRLIDAVRNHDASGLFCISGDTHWAEMSCRTRNVPYPLWDLTSSGLTETWPVVAPNAHRAAPTWREPNFGMIDIDWRANGARIDLRVLDLSGIERLHQRLDTDQLRGRPGGDQSSVDA
jgi:alkaline phosphatase D